MNESEFLNASDQIFDRIENGLDDGEFDVDLNRNGNVLEIEFDDGAKIVVNRHAANQEIWLAARSGGFHYRYQDGHWRSTRDEGELFTQLADMVLAHAARRPHF
ncbi:iron donor protein CyaY [Chitinimonas viridis]|uniref:Iron-sulfur cluster assembly protein CyaY n=1 Tax=Chitinimonas viridis TaxID=664880 RepID=A0ABT8B245_9NEIS|nr:iron donor protein CyaY [Chitinimonas viridis]MDN3575564.1 iron donor protein CyaY [Chitinimonas viridis]